MTVWGDTLWGITPICYITEKETCGASDCGANEPIPSRNELEPEVVKQPEVIKRDELINPFWAEDSELGDGPIQPLHPSESQFFRVSQISSRLS